METSTASSLRAGRALRAIRIFHDISLTEAARKLDFAKSYISDLENDRKTPSLDALQRYSAVFDIPVSSILLLVENEKECADTFKAKVRSAVAKRILRVLELMGSAAA